jgi:hypothetical protein
MGVLIDLIISFFSVLPFWRSDRVNTKTTPKTGHKNWTLQWCFELVISKSDTTNKTDMIVFLQSPHIALVDGYDTVGNTVI